MAGILVTVYAQVCNVCRPGSAAGQFRRTETCFYDFQWNTMQPFESVVGFFPNANFEGMHRLRKQKSCLLIEESQEAVK